MTEFLQHAMELPTIIPFSIMIGMFIFFIISILFGFDKSIDHSIEISELHSDAHIGETSGHGGFLSFIGIKSGVHTTSLIFIAFFLNFAVTFMISRYVDLNSDILRQSIGCVMVILLFPVLNNLAYLLLKPIGNFMAKAERTPESLIGKKGKIESIFDNKKMANMNIDGFSESMIVFFEKEEIENYTVGDKVEIHRQDLDDGLNTEYYVKKID